MITIGAKLFLNLTRHNKLLVRTRTGFIEDYAQSLSVDCDLDLCPSDMVLVRDTLSCHDNYLSNYFLIPSCIKSYGSDTNRFL